MASKINQVHLFLALLPAAAACGGGDQPEPPAVVRPVATLTIGTAERRGFSFPGVVQATNRADLAFRVPGSLIQLPVNEGDQVRRGQLLARLDPMDYQLALDEARATYEQAEANYQRFKRLYEREAVSLAEVEAHRARRDVSKARLDQAQTNLGYATLRAPFAGLVGRRFVENFEDVQAKETILSLQNVDTVEIVINVPERFLALARGTRGLEFAATFPTVPSLEFPMWLKEVAAEADPRTQTYAVTFAMRQPDELNALPGMTAEVWIRQGDQAAAVGQPTFLIPAAAVFAAETGETSVWVLQSSGTVSRRPVEVGELVAPDRIQILGGLEVGETIAVAAVTQLREGMEVRPMTQN